MAHTQCTNVCSALKRLFPDSVLRSLARQSGFVRRQRKIDVVCFFWSLVFGFSVGGRRTISGIRRNYELASGQRIAPSAFYNRFNSSLLALLKAASERALNTFQLAGVVSEDLASSFRDIVLADSTVFKVHDQLRSSFRGSRRKNTPAAAKIHMVCSVLGKGKSTVALTAENVPEIRKFKVGPWVRGKLLLFDLGFFSYELFTKIKNESGFFVTPMKQKANPRIVRLLKPISCKKDLVGMKVHDAVNLFSGETIDAEVEITFQPKAARRRGPYVRKRLRVVGIYNPRFRTYHLYMTNLYPENLDADAVAAVYRARWEIELLFKELKSGYKLHQVSSRKRHVAEILIYAALLTLLASRQLYRLFSRARPRGATAGRWWRLLQAYAQKILVIVVRPRHMRQVQLNLSRAIIHELRDPHTKRRPLLISSLVNHEGYPKMSQRTSPKPLTCS